MNRQFGIRKKYKLYTLYGSNSGVPARTQRRWAMRRKMERTSMLEENSGQEKASSSKEPPAPEMGNNFRNSTDESLPDEVETGRELFDVDNGLASNVINHGSASEDSDESDDELISLNEGTPHAQASPSLPIACPLLFAYSTEEVIPPLMALVTKLWHNFSYAATEDALQLAKALTNARIIYSSKCDCKKISDSLGDYLSIYHFCEECQSYIGKELTGCDANQNDLTCPGVIR